MNLSNFIGVITGVLFLAAAIGFAADDPMAFINLPGFLIVVGGTFTAILVSVPYREALAALKQARIVTEPLEMDLKEDAAKLLFFSKLWFRKQSRVIDDEIEKLDDRFMQRGLQMIRDQQTLEDILAALNWKISQCRSAETATINVFKSMATFAPAFGMVGSLIGLVNMLQEIEGGVIASVTSDMAIALVTTFYGLLLANLIFKPIASKLEQRRQQKTIRLSMIAEGITMIYQNKTPSAVQDNLFTYIQDQDEHTTESVIDAIAKHKVSRSKTAIANA